MQLMESGRPQVVDFAKLISRSQATNQGVVGSIPASRTKLEKPATVKLQAFFLLL